MAEIEEERQRRWDEIQRHAESVRQVHPARRLQSERDMLWLVEEVQRLREESERRADAAGPGRRPANLLKNAA